MTQSLDNPTSILTPKPARPPTPMMTPAETAFLASHLRKDDHLWEWGSGGSTVWLSERVRFVTTVEHQAKHAADLIALAPQNVSVILAPPEPGCHYREGSGDDGDLNSFRRYVECFSGKGITAVLIDGRARPWCARQIAEIADFGPFPEERIFIHDAHRTEVARIWTPQDEGDIPHFKLIDRVDSLVLLHPVLD